MKVAVLFGGKSGEHEISLRSATSVIRHLKSSVESIFPIYIDHDGKWFFDGEKSLVQSVRQGQSLLDLIPKNQSSFSEVKIKPYANAKFQFEFYDRRDELHSCDVVFPVLHGTFGEDGTLQGFLELMEVAYVGSGVLSSSVTMDKGVAKKVCESYRIPVVPYDGFTKKNAFGSDGKLKQEVFEAVKNKLSYPVFTKPANLGSSVGIYKVKSEENLEKALMDSFQYDECVLIEKGLEVREIELAVLGSSYEGEMQIGEIGEIIPSDRHEFYSYEAKYTDEFGAKLEIPASLTKEQSEAAKKMALDSFRALQCEGFARVDLFLDKNSGKFYLNEINTIPGFTSISMFPKMMEASGVKYPELLERLLELAVQRRDRRRKILRKFQ